MDRHSFCGYDCEIYNTTIGSFCSIANEVAIGGGNHPMNWVSTSPVFYAGRDSVRVKYSEHERKKPHRTIIGHDVWIGQRVLIKQGVQIGTGAVVGMGSVVTKSVPPYAIVAGNPATIIRYRFDSNTINKLLKSEWWLLPSSNLKKAANKITDVERFLDLVNEKENSNKL
tara:strand:+ start:377 stop:886 length:510 start_codon:yes stop_codon:yes gene_type:complete